MARNEDIAQAAQAYLKGQGAEAGSYERSREVLIVPQGKLTHFVHLSPLRRVFRDADEHGRRRLFERRLLALRKTPEVLTDEMLAERLLPRLRPSAWFVAQALHRKIVERVEHESGEELTVPSKKVFGAQADLAAHLVFELSEECADVNDARLSGWKRQLDPLYETALENLRRRTPSPMELIKPKLYASSLNDGHDAARLLLRERLDAIPLQGELLVMVPHFDLLLATTKDSISAVVEMAKLSLQATQQPFGLVGKAYLRTYDGLTEWMPERMHPAYDALRMARLPAESRAYTKQKELLEAWHELEQDSTEVAPFVILEEDDELFSAGLWVTGSNPLLPRAERIAFAVPDKGDNARVWALPWEVAAKIPGVRLDPVPLEPVRYRASGFPDVSVLETELKNL